MSSPSKKFVFRALAKAILGNFALSLGAFLLGKILGGPNIYVENTTAFDTSALLFTLFLSLVIWGLLALYKFGSAENLIKIGPYKFVRHPMYAAIIFLLNPAIAIYLRSWLMLLAVIPIYFIWRKAIKTEEIYFEERFKTAFFDYKEKTWPFFPSLWRFNKLLGYAVSAAAIFSIVFVGLNFSAVQLRWINYETKTVAVSDSETEPQYSPADFQNLFEGNEIQKASVQASKASFNSAPNSIIIAKLNVNAPLVTPGGASQKELNDALNQGVIIYPGSVLPGQNGEVFLSGHSSIYPWIKTNYGQVFTLLDKLEAGDKVTLVYDHIQYEYLITGKEVKGANDVRVEGGTAPRLTLMTCWPIGTALKRLVVRGELIK